MRGHEEKAQSVGQKEDLCKDPGEGFGIAGGRATKSNVVEGGRAERRVGTGHRGL